MLDGSMQWSIGRRARPVYSVKGEPAMLIDGVHGDGDNAPVFESQREDGSRSHRNAIPSRSSSLLLIKQPFAFQPASLVVITTAASTLPSTVDEFAH
jgi:hypothetical protein